MLSFFTFGEVMVFEEINLPCLSAQKRPNSGKVMPLTRQSYGYSDKFRMKGNRPGDPNEMTIRFKAVNAGQTTLKLLYHRRWEADEAPQETFSIEVRVQ
jgi:predicted secreted protein